MNYKGFDVRENDQYYIGKDSAWIGLHPDYDPTPEESWQSGGDPDHLVYGANAVAVMAAIDQLCEERDHQTVEWWKQADAYVEITEMMKSGQWWIGFAEVELDNGDVVRCSCEGFTQDWNEVCTIETIEDVEYDLAAEKQ